MAAIFKVSFEIKKAGTGAAGPADQYRRGARSALLLANSAHPKDILSVLNSNLTLAAGEVIEILAVAQDAAGTEGAGVLQ
jgi:hypothetical protein